MNIIRKNLLFSLLFIVGLISLVSSCSKDEGSVEENIIGKWDVVELYINGQWVSVEEEEAWHLNGAYVQFYPERRYESWGHLGLAVGQYDISGNMIICYLNGMEFSRYEVLEQDGHYAEFNAWVFGELMRIRCHLDENPEDNGHVCNH